MTGDSVGARQMLGASAGPTSNLTSTPARLAAAGPAVHSNWSMSSGEFDEAGIAIDDVGLRRPTLDDVFLTLTGHSRPPAEDPTPQRRRAHERA